MYSYTLYATVVETLKRGVYVSVVFRSCRVQSGSTLERAMKMKDKSTIVVLCGTFLAGTVFGWCLKTWRLKWLAAKRDWFAKKAFKAHDKLTEESSHNPALQQNISLECGAGIGGRSASKLTLKSAKDEVARIFFSMMFLLHTIIGFVLQKIIAITVKCLYISIIRTILLIALIFVLHN